MGMEKRGGEKDRIPEVLGSLRMALDNPITRHILQYLSRDNALEKALGVFTGTETRTCVRCQFNSFLLGTAIKYGAKALGAKDDAFIEYFRDKTTQRGLANVIRGIAEYGVTKPQKLHAPFLVVWDYTKACNLRCVHCYAEAGKCAPDELTTEERKRVVDQLHDAGVVALSFSGGEPLVCKDFFEVAEYARVALEAIHGGKGDVVAPTHFAGAKLEGRTASLVDFIGGCGAGRLYCSIEHNGDIQPCVFMPIRVTSIDMYAADAVQGRMHTAGIIVPLIWDA